MKCAIGYVLYNPTVKQINSINAIFERNIFQLNLIYDNSSYANLSFFSDQDILYYSNLKNEGLAKAYNLFIDIACQNNCDYLCIMDQDSKYEIEEIQKMINLLQENVLQDFAIIAPRSYAEISKILPRQKKITYVKYVINSGSFLNLREIEKAQIRYDENLFLDGVDYEFCWQAREQKLNILIYEDSVLKQNLGYVTTKLGSKFCCHDALRYYYIVKGRNYYNIKHMGRIRGQLINLIKFFKTIFLIIIYEDAKIEKIKYCLYGWRKEDIL